MKEKQKLYAEMTSEEQLQWITDYAKLVESYKTMAAPGTAKDLKEVQRLFNMLTAWPFAQEFCEKARRYGDYMARFNRLSIYMDKVNEALSEGLTMTDNNGQIVAFVAPSTPMRRRGRPTKEEVAARLRGETVTVQGGDNAENRKRRAIAKMLGLQVVISGNAPREKNNAELAAERAARKEEEAKRNPSLFPVTNGSTTPTAPAASPSGPSLAAPAAAFSASSGSAAAPSSSPTTAAFSASSGSAAAPAASPSGTTTTAPSPCAQLMSDSYEARMAQDKLHLDQLAWLVSKPLQERIKLVQSQRTAAEAASERAKLLAEMNSPQNEIAEYAEQAKVATEAYLKTYADIDDELAILHKRLYLDIPFVEKFKTRFKGVDIERVQYITRPYYEKTKSPELDVRIRTIIEQENPEYAAKMKAEQEKKEELQQLHRYIMRTDKPASDERVKTMTERIERVRQLAGNEVADSYLPVLEKTKEENRKRNEAKNRPTPDPSLLGRGVDSDAEKKKPKKSAKAVSKREQGDAGIDHAEREQARRDNGKQESKKSTKQEDKKKPAAE